MSPRITFKSCGSSSTLKRRNILPTLVILGSLQSLNTSRSAPPFVSQFAGEHRNLLMRRKMRLRETWKRSAAAWRRFYLWHRARLPRSQPCAESPVHSDADASATTESYPPMLRWPENHQVDSRDRRARAGDEAERDSGFRIRYRFE